MSDIRFFELTDSAADLQRLTAFYQSLFTDGFPDPDERESLENMQAYLQARQAGWYASEGPRNNYHIVLADLDGETIAAAVCDYLAVPNSGIIEFLLVAEAVRGRGIGRRMHEFVESILQQDARDAGHAGLDGITIEMNDPFRVDLAADNMDPFERARLWGRWGYAALAFPYVQPALSADQAPVTCLLLCFKPTSARWNTSVGGPVVRQIVHGYLRWAMRIERPDDDPVFQQMSQALRNMTQVRLISLQQYVGEDPARPFQVVPIERPDGPQLSQVLAVYQRSFPPGETAIAPAVFAETLGRLTPGHPACRYHLWGIQQAETGTILGMASFFTLAQAGFLGYLTLTGEFVGTGRCRLLLARIEEQLVRDQPGISEWYLECEAGSKQFAVFAKLGFSPVDIPYQQPSMALIDPSAPKSSPEQSLVLMRKVIGLGVENQPLSSARLSVHLTEIFEYVYRMPRAQAAAVAERLVS